MASLNHPHVLRVFDWGEDTDGPYLVLEYLHGGSLRDVLDRGFRLSPSQAARLGAQAAQGLAYAHARGLVHRDVKPANLLFDEEGRVRIADFGVARALAEAAWTEPAGAMVGTARYASPEQAQGKSVDGRADVYSLALVLYEALTGEVPFATDTTMGTLMARVGATLPRHPLLGPLDDVLARAAAPEVGDRLDAARLAARLEAVAASLPPPEPLPLLGTADGGPGRPGRAFGAPAAQDLTAVVPAVDDRSAVDQPATGVLPTGAAAATVRPTTGRAQEVFDIDALEGAAWADTAGDHRAADPPPPSPPVLRRSRRRRWPWVIGVAVLVLAAAVAGVALGTQAFTPSHPVPKLAGQSLAAARKATAADHFTLAVGAPVHSLRVAAGSVVSQRPAAGISRKQGATIAVVPSSGPPPVRVPTLAGLDCAAVTKQLALDHLAATCPALQAYNATVPTGQVINWSYQGKLDATVVPYGATIDVAISKGKPPVPVPSVAGDTSFTQAQSALQAVGLQATQAQTSSTTVAAGQVIGTDPAAGVSATVGTTVKVIISTGPPIETVPNLSNDTVQAATSALQQVGLAIGQVYGPPGGRVFTTVPLAGQQLRKGSAVNLYTE